MANGEQQMTPGTQQLMDMMPVLSATEADRVPIKPGQEAKALGDIALALEHDLPEVGEEASMVFPATSDGEVAERPVTVTGYDKDFAQVEIPFPGSEKGSVGSNVDLRAFEKLTRGSRAAADPKNN